MTDDYAEIRQALTDRRRALLLNQDNIARRMGTGQSNVSDLETGRIPNPTIDTVIRWANALNATIRLSWGND